MNKITIFGAGYVGLVTAACLANLGNNVLVIDIDEHRVKQLQQGVSPIHEPGLDSLLQRNIEANRLSFTTNPTEAIQHGNYQFIAVGTPSDEDGSADLSYVLKAARTIGENMQDYRLVVTKSTVPVGTAERVQETIKKSISNRGLNIDFDVVSNPEFLREGAAIHDFMYPHRIIVGAINAKAFEAMDLLYQPLNPNGDRILHMNLRSSELTKYAANAFLATKISFMNEISQLCERLGADVEWVRQGLAKDPRIGDRFLFPGSGYGGSCFPKDVRALRRVAEERGFSPQILGAVESVNKIQKQLLFKKLNHYFKDKLEDKVIAVWGLAFKPNTDDMREASSRELIEALWREGAIVQAYDPIAMTEARRIYGKRNGFKLCASMEEALEGADALTIVTEWSQFKNPDLMLIKSKLRHPVIFDGRNLLEPSRVKAHNLAYYAIGRGDSLCMY